MENATQIDILNTLVSTESILYQNLKNYHWNVQGLHFMELHSFFQGLYEERQDTIDDLAERVRALQGRPLSQFSVYLEWSLINEEQRVDKSELDILNQLEKDYTILVDSYYKFIDQIDNEVTRDLLIQITSNHEKNLWKIKSLLN